TRECETGTASPGTLEWSAPRAAVDAQAAWPAAVAGKGEDGPPREAQTAGAGGPDPFGYRWTDSSEPTGPVFHWADIASPANVVALAGDEAVSAPVPLGFSFPFYGRRFTQVRLCTNGYLPFGNTGPVFANTRRPPGSAPPNRVAAFWDDLIVGAGVGRAYARFDGTRCVLSWVGVQRYNDLSSRMTFQCILYPSGEIRFQYLRMTGIVADATIGIQDSSRTAGLLVA